MRLIDADALMQQVVKKKFSGSTIRYQEGFNDAILRVRSMIHSAPTFTHDPEYVEPEYGANAVTDTADTTDTEGEQK